MEQQLNLGIIYFLAVNSVIIWGGLKRDKKYHIVLTSSLSQIIVFPVNLWPKRKERGQQIWKWGYVSYSLNKEKNKIKAPFLIWKCIKCFPSTLKRKAGQSRNSKVKYKFTFIMRCPRSCRRHCSWSIGVVVPKKLLLEWAQKGGFGSSWWLGVASSMFKENNQHLHL